MSRRFGAIAFGPAVKKIQERMGSRRAYARADGATEPDTLGPDEIAFLESRDSFYLASIGENGWPYVQHRGGAKGFVRVLDASTLAWTEQRGNRQYVTAGNVSVDDRVSLIFVDYPTRARLKLLGRARLEGNEIVVRVEAFDWNCPQYITPRYTLEELVELGVIPASAEPLGT